MDPGEADKPDREQLESRVEQLEQTVSKMLPDRRGVIKGLGAAAIGAGVGTSAASGQASSDTSDGTVRGNGGGVDVRLDQLRDPGGDQVFDVDDTGAVNAQPREWVFNSLRTEGARISARDYSGRRPAQLGTSLEFNARFIGEPFGGGGSDPMIFDRSVFDDGRYRILIQLPDVDDHELYTTTDFNSFSLVASGLYGSVAANGNTFNDHIVLDDGTFCVYEADSGSTDLWQGDDLQSLSEVGTVVPEDDPGVIRDGETVHIYTEDTGAETPSSSDKLSHWTTPIDDLTNETEQGDAIDVTDRPWVTGDPDVYQLNGGYYMFHDNTINHPQYYIALSYSRDLYNWEIINERLTHPTRGGDMVVIERGGMLEALTEYSQAQSEGDFTIGHWRLDPYPTGGSYPIATERDRRTATAIDETISFTETPPLIDIDVRAQDHSSNLNDIQVQVNGKTTQYYYLDFDETGIQTNTNTGQFTLLTVNADSVGTWSGTINGGTQLSVDPGSPTVSIHGNGSPSGNARTSLLRGSVGGESVITSIRIISKGNATGTIRVSGRDL